MPDEAKRKKALAAVIRAVEFHEALLEITRKVVEAGSKGYIGKPVKLPVGVFEAARAVFLKVERSKDA